MKFGSIEEVLAGEATCALLHGDCRVLLRLLPDNSLDSIVDDPPETGGHVNIVVTGIDPGYRHGGIARMSTIMPPKERCVWCESLPKFVGDQAASVEHASSWFCKWLQGEHLPNTSFYKPAPNDALVEIVVLEKQGRSHFGALARGKSNPNAAYVREVVGAIRYVCRHASPVRVVREMEPSETRSLLGLKKGATKDQMFAVVSNVLGLRLQRSNEHVRDAIVLSFVGTVGANVWLDNWLRNQTKMRPK